MASAVRTGCPTVPRVDGPEILRFPKRGPGSWAPRTWRGEARKGSQQPWRQAEWVAGFWVTVSGRLTPLETAGQASRRLRQGKGGTAGTPPRTRPAQGAGSTRV